MRIYSSSDYIQEKLDIKPITRTDLDNFKKCSSIKSLLKTGSIVIADAKTSSGDWLRHVYFYISHEDCQDYAKLIPEHPTNYKDSEEGILIRPNGFSISFVSLSQLDNKMNIDGFFATHFIYEDTAQKQPFDKNYMEQVSKSIFSMPSAKCIYDSNKLPRASKAIKEKLDIKPITKTRLSELSQYNFFPNTKEELIEIIVKRINEEGLECDLNDIDVSKITDMSYLFSEYDETDKARPNKHKEMHNFDGDISKWNVSNVKNMRNMFAGSAFGGGISEWNVSNVTNMSGMFMGSYFNDDISKWDVGKVTDMSDMFWGTRKFHGDLSKWDVSNVETMWCMFSGSSFNGDISKWDVRKVKRMYCMFYDSDFNQDISKWNVSQVTNMEHMFENSNFDQDISEWDVRNVDKHDAAFKNSPLDVFKGKQPRFVK